MSTIAVLGASGFTGRLVLTECIARGHRPVAIGRDAERVRSALREDGHDLQESIADIRAADTTDAASLRSALHDVDLLLTTVGPFDLLGRTVLDAAIETGTHYVDVTGEQPFIRWAYGERDVAARDAGIVAVPAAGFDFLPGDLLAGLAGAAVAWPSEIHIAYTIPSSGIGGVASSGTRRTIATQLGAGCVAFEHGELVSELPAEVRRLAWFPRPVGPRHAAGIPGGEPITVPRHVPGVATVRTYFALSGWKAELLQMGANAARWAPVRRVVQRVLEAGSSDPSAERRAATRWGCVAEAKGDDGIARAWAYGHDMYGLTAVAMVAVGEAILTGEALPGVQPPALVAPPGDLLDRIAERSDLRWSLARPEPPENDGAGIE